MDSIDSNYQQESSEQLVKKGKTFGAVGMMVSISTILCNLLAVYQILEERGNIIAFLPLTLGMAGITLSIIGRINSTKAGVGNGMAIAGIIIGLFALSHAVVLTIIAFE